MIKLKVIECVFVITILTATLVGLQVSTYSQPAYAAPACVSGRFLTFPTWYRGLVDPKDPSCGVVMPSDGKGNADIALFVWTIVLNIIEMALQVVAYAAAGYIIFGGFKYLTSTGSPDKTVAARKTIIHALVGLVLSFMSIAIVNFVVGNIT